MAEICAKLLISRLKIGGAMAISLVAMATATLILFFNVVKPCQWIELVILNKFARFHHHTPNNKNVKM